MSTDRLFISSDITVATTPTIKRNKSTVVFFIAPILRLFRKFSEAVTKFLLSFPLFQITLRQLSTLRLII